jgi:hypothetical protein
MTWNIADVLVHLTGHVLSPSVPAMDWPGKPGGQTR